MCPPPALAPAHPTALQVAPKSVAPESVAPKSVAPESVAPESVAPEVGSPAHSISPKARAHRTIALVDLDAFYVSVERRRDPALGGRPVVVGGLPHERGVVSCASYEARGHGVHAGMPLVEAGALLPARCPACVRAQLQPPAVPSAAQPPAGGSDGGCPRGCPVFLHGDHAAYAQASRAVMEVLEGFTPALETVSLDEAYLDLTGCERHHRSWTAAAHALREAVLAATGLSVSVGIGATRAVAKVAAALAKPAGILVVRPGEERAFLAALPLEHLPGIGEKTRIQLERFNLHGIGDLAAMPDDLLEATFGRMGPALARRARGLEDDDGDPRITSRFRSGREPKTRSISRDTTFAEDTDDAQVVDGMLSYLAQRAARALRAAGLRARAVGVRLRYSDFDTVETRQRLPAPTDLDHEILERVRALWPARWTRRVRLRLVGVVLHDLVESGERQLDLGLSGGVSEALASYTPGSRLGPEEERAVDRAVDRIRDRHGFGALVRGRAITLLDRPTNRRAARDTRTDNRPVAAKRWSRHGLRLQTPACSR